MKHTPYHFEFSPYAVHNPDPSDFKDDGAEQSDINYIVNKFLKTGEFPTSQKKMVYQEMPQQDVNTIYSEMSQMQHSEWVNEGSGSADPVQTSNEVVTAVSDEGDPEAPIVQKNQPEADLDSTEAIQIPKPTKTKQKVPQG